MMVMMTITVSVIIVTMTTNRIEMVVVGQSDVICTCLVTHFMNLDHRVLITYIYHSITATLTL